jgi:hypothetical protein
MFGWKRFTFAAPNPEHKPTPETSPKRKLDPETLTSGNSDFESAKESPALKPTGRRESPDPQIELVEGKPYLGIEQTKTKRTKLIEGGPLFEFEETYEPLAESSYWTEPRPEQLYSPIKNLIASIQNLNQPTTLNTITMAQPVNGSKELNLNKPNTFDGDRARLGKQRIILGFFWLNKHNPIIDWKKGEITWRPFQIDWRCLYKKGQRIRKERQPNIEEVVDKEETKNRTTSPLKKDKMEVYIKLLETNVWIHKTNIAMELAIEENSKRIEKTDKELVPEEYYEYLDIFNEEKAH